MIVRLIKKKKIYNFTLPTKIAGNYWITDNDYLGNVRNLINVEEDNGRWKIKSDFETKIMSGEMEVESAYLKDYSLYFLKINTDNEYVILYCSPTVDKESYRLRLRDKKELLIGNYGKAPICFNFPLVSREHAKLTYNDGVWIVQDLNSKYGTYVNSIAITARQLQYGDIIFIMGLKIIVLKDTLIINNIGSNLSIDNNYLESISSIAQTQTEFDNPDEETIEFYKEDDYFYRAPRFKTGIVDANIVIDPPPGKMDGNGQETPLIYTLGPMLTMGMSSMSTGISALQAVINGTSDWQTVAPTLAMTGAMMATMFLWPNLQKSYQKKLAKKAEKERNVKYLKYLESKKEKIQQASTQDMYKMVAETVRSFSRTKTGALITFEKTTPLDNVIKNGTLVNAPVSPELLMTIFYPGTRLHDGAVVIRGNMILAASVYYTPTSRALTGKFGSRHRAAVGISEVSDSVTVVVSEETGRISLAYKAKIESTTYDNFLDDLIDLMNDKD